MLKIITSAASGLIVAGGIGYGYVQKAQEHLAKLEADNVTLTATVRREDTAIDLAIKTLQAARKAPATTVDGGAP
jgi:predicted RNA-binding protein with RPS1 domain